MHHPVASRCGAPSGDDVIKADDELRVASDGGLNEEILEELLALRSAADFRGLRAARPELAAPLLKSQLRELSAAPGYGAGFERLLYLLDAAEADIDVVWAEYERALNEATAAGEELAAEESAVREALDRGDLERVLELTVSAIPRAAAAGLGAGASMLHELRGLALLRRHSAERSADVESAIEELERARFLAPPGPPSGSVLMHLAFAYSDRLRGDLADNTEVAVELLRLAVVEVAGADVPDLAAMVDTNLAFGLMRRMRGERVDNLGEAVDACERALSHRSLERDPVDWAYSQLNLGDALDQLELTRGARGVSDRAKEPYEAVIRAAKAIPEKWLVGLAHHGVGRLYLRAAQLNVEDIVDAAESGHELSAEVDAQALAVAREQLERACAQLEDAEHQVYRGRALAGLAEALTLQDDVAAAIDVGRQALVILRPTNAPRACLAVAGQLGTQLAVAGRWDEATAVFRDAVAAADLTFYAQLERSSSDEEQRRAGNVYRWAAYAIARTGDAEGAALVLENGRAREIRRRIDSRREDSRLAELPESLRDAYVAAAAHLGSSPLGEDAAVASRAYAEVVSAIRDVPGYESFGAGARLEELTAAAEPGWPVIYVNPTPFGTLLVAVTADDGATSVSSAFVDGVTSTDVIMRLMVGAAPAPADEANGVVGEPTSYLFGISGPDDDDYAFGPALDELLPWLGEAIARPLWSLLSESRITGCTMIVCGPLALAPLHAATWQDGDRTCCLLDYVTVRHAPAAMVSSACLLRAAVTEASPRTLVAVADPTGDLPATGPEVTEISSFFAADDVACAFAAAADRHFLQARAASATFIHLASHAYAPLLAAGDAFVLLADGPLSADEIAGLARLDARLVVVSACQSAVSRLDDLPDEAISLGTTMIIAGAACTVASLWPVDDAATAMLMIRLYEEVLQNGYPPPTALRRAQLWLRDLSETAEADFLSKHPALAAEFRRRAETRELPGRRSGPGATGDDGPSIYGHPEYWAAFVAVGT
ncbi:MAG: CHAT domain-containing protein [Gaiellaceae bacterium]